MPQIEIFGGPNCGYCEAAKALLRAHELTFVEYDVTADAVHLAEFRRTLPRLKAVPQLFVDGEHIGGLEDFRLAIAAGRLSGGALR